MNVALSNIYYIFDKFIDFVFNGTIFFQGVSIGWVVISIFIFSFVIRNILTVPSVRSKGSTGTEKSTRKDS